MKLYYGGAEIKAWRELLREQDIPAVSLSFVGISRKSAFTFDLKNYYPGDMFLDSGAYTFNNSKITYDLEDVYETAALYMKYIEQQIGNVTLVSEFDAKQLGSDIRNMRSDFYDKLPPEKFMPVWHPEDGRDELEEICSKYQIVGVCQTDIHGDTSYVPIFNSMIQRYNVRLHGVGMTSKKLIAAVKWDSVSSTSWISPARYGDTFIWTGSELKRYPKDYKDRRKAYKNLIIDNGFDYSKIEADDSKELLKLSLWSWKHYVDSISGVTNIIKNEIPPEGETEGLEDGIQDKSRGTSVIKLRQTQIIPVMENVFKPENEDEESFPLLTVRSESMRICDTCFLRDRCPGYQPKANCLYNIPIEIKTKDQLRSLHDALIGMQTHRVMFMKMAEDINGGYADPNLSAEIDRLNRMIKVKTDGEKNTFSATLNISETRQEPSFLENILGKGTIGKLRELESPVNADEIIMGTEIVEAEIVS